jgi:hypothetical protein
MIFSMTAATCFGGGGKSSRNDSEADGNESFGEGNLTITGLPKQEYALLIVGTDADLSSFLTVTFAIMSFEGGGNQITSGGNVFEIYNYPETTPWTVTGKRQVVLLNGTIKDSDDTLSLLNKNNPLYSHATVNFSKGKARVRYNSFTPVTKHY